MVAGCRQGHLHYCYESDEGQNNRDYTNVEKDAACDHQLGTLVVLELQCDDAAYETY